MSILAELIKMDKKELAKRLCVECRGSHLHCKNCCNKLDRCPQGQAMLMKVGLRDIPDDVKAELGMQSKAVVINTVPVKPVEKERHGLQFVKVLDGDFGRYSMDGDCLVLIRLDGSKVKYSKAEIEAGIEAVEAYRMLNQTVKQKVRKAATDKCPGNLKNPRWTSDELKLMREHLGISRAEMLALFPDKSAHAVDCKLCAMRKEIKHGEY